MSTDGAIRIPRRESVVEKEFSASLLSAGLAPMNIPDPLIERERSRYECSTPAKSTI